MILSDYFRSTPDAAWQIAKECGVDHAVIRLPEDKEFDITSDAHWDAVHKRFTDFAEHCRGMSEEQMAKAFRPQFGHTFFYFYFLVNGLQTY